jgi:hypothetical protein
MMRIFDPACALIDEKQRNPVAESHLAKSSPFSTACMRRAGGSCQYRPLPQAGLKSRWNPPATAGGTDRDPLP